MDDLKQAYVQPRSATGVRPGTILPLDTVRTPGAYVCNWSGHLLRVPADSVARLGALPVNIVGSAPLTVTKISDNAELPLSEARNLAAWLGLSVGF